MRPGGASEESNAHNKVFERFATEKRCGPKSSAGLGPFCFVDKDYTPRVQPRLSAQPIRPAESSNAVEWEKGTPWGEHGGQRSLQNWMKRGRYA